MLGSSPELDQKGSLPRSLAKILFFLRAKKGEISCFFSSCRWDTEATEMSAKHPRHLSLPNPQANPKKESTKLWRAGKLGHIQGAQKRPRIATSCPLF